VSFQGSSTTLTFRFPKFNTKVTYDPAITGLGSTAADTTTVAATTTTAAATTEDATATAATTTAAAITENATTTDATTTDLISSAASVLTPVRLLLGCLATLLASGV